MTSTTGAMEETQMSGFGRQDSSIKEQPISTVTDCRRSDNKIDSQTESFERKQYVDGGMLLKPCSI